MTYIVSYFNTRNQFRTKEIITDSTNKDDISKLLKKADKEMSTISNIERKEK